MLFSLGHSSFSCSQKAVQRNRGAREIVYAIEIEPAYVDVTVTRWEDFTGRKAKRLTKRHEG